jgi:hypothetical protein
MFNGYFDERSEALDAFTGRKLRQPPPDDPLPGLAVTVPPVVLAGLRRLARAARRLTGGRAMEAPGAPAPVSSRP